MQDKLNDSTNLRFHEKRIHKMLHIIKIGGNVLDNPPLLEHFVSEFAALLGPKILVHGGGVMASQLQEDMGMEPVMIEGRRVTDQETLRVVTMVYAGWANKSLVALLQGAGCNAMGLAGCDANLICANRRPPIDINGEMTDFGFVGDVQAESVNAQQIMALLNLGITPVFSAINHDGKGSLLNTNADTMAASIAKAMAAETDVKLTFCFEKPGVLLDRDDDDSVIPTITPDTYKQLKADGGVAAGMIPKLDNAFAAIAAGVKSVEIKHAADLRYATGTTLISPQ